MTTDTINTQLRDENVSIATNKENSGYKKIQACFRLMNIADQKSLNAIYKVLREDTCELVRHEAAFCLGEMASEDSKNTLLECLEKDSATTVKHECLMSLGRIIQEEDLVKIEKYLKHPNTAISNSAKIAFEEVQLGNTFEEEFENFKNEDFKAKIEGEMLDENTPRNKKIQIIFQLMKLNNDYALTLLEDSFHKEKCEIVRHEIAFVLGEMANNKAVKLLMKLIKIEEHPIVIHEGLFALGSSGNKIAIEFVKNYLEHKEYIVSESAKIALDRLEKLDNPYRGI